MRCPKACFLIHRLSPSLCDLRPSVSMDVKEEMMEILEKLSTKLRGLLQASALDLGAFFVIILFVGEFDL